MGQQLYNAFQNVETAKGAILGLAFFIARLFGFINLIWGIYGMVIARKDGDASQITTNVTKMTIGLLMIFLPSILRGAGILA